MEKTIRALIIDDHSLIREGIAMILNNEPGFIVLGQGSSAIEAVYLAESLQPDVILLDMDLPVNGITLARAIARLSPETRFIYLTVSERCRPPIRPVPDGGRVYVLRNIAGEDLFKILRKVCGGKNSPAPAAAVPFSNKNRAGSRHFSPDAASSSAGGSRQAERSDRRARPAKGMISSRGKNIFGETYLAIEIGGK